MSETKHTPGPWAVSESADIGFDIVTPDWCVAGSNGVEREADARLIAAAPELLEALQLVVDKLGTDYELYREQQFAIDTARVAIAKAAGTAA